MQQEDEFFDLDKSSMGLVQVACDVWEGFIFVNFAEQPDQSLQEFLGEMLTTGLVGYPFGEMTNKWTFRSDIKANWKLFIDAFVEFYHAPILHSKQYEQEEFAKLVGYGFEALHYELFSPHSMVSSWGGIAPPKDESMVKPMERALRSGPLRSVGQARRRRRSSRRASTPLVTSRGASTRSCVFPNFMILIWEPEWYLTYHYWPTSHNSHTFEVSLYFVPPKNATERLRQEMAVAVDQGVRAAGRQHARGHADDDRDRAPSRSSSSTTRRSSAATTTPPCASTSVRTKRARR